MQHWLRYFLSLTFAVIIAETTRAQWVQTKLDSAYVRAFAFDEPHLFVGTATGVYLSTNNGMSWTAVDSGLTNTNIQSLAVQETTIFAGTYFGGVFRSTNNGTTWNPASIGLANMAVYSLAIDSGSGGTSVFAGTGAGVCLSSNNGSTWSPTGLTGQIVHSLAITPPDSSGREMLLAGTQDGIFISTNGGTNWAHRDSAMLFMNQVLSLAVGLHDSSGSENLFAGTSGGIFLSTDSGVSWAPADSGLPTPGGFLPPVFSLAVVGRNLFAGVWGCGVFLSTDNAASWTDASSGLTNQHLLALAPTGANLFAGTSGSGVWMRPLREMIPLEVEASMDQGWNLVSVPVNRTDYRTTQLYPSAISGAYAFESGAGYVVRDTLKNGPGYWLKFASSETLGVGGYERSLDTVSVTQGWNLIGSISHPVATNSVIQIPPGIVLTDYFAFAGSYVPTDTLYSGKGYWVKVSESGQLILR